MQSNKEPQVTVSISGAASVQPSAVTVPTSAVPLELLRQYSSRKPLRRGPTPPRGPGGSGAVYQT
jgi:hypothetical protein